MFGLSQQSVKLSSVNPRSELHRYKKVPACNLKFGYAADNADMAQFATDQQDIFDDEEKAVACFCGD